MVKLDIKPLSINEAWMGRRFKTQKYKQYRKDVLSMLTAKKLPEPPFEINIIFGFSSKGSDWDNCIKLFQDIVAEKYGFNDNLIYRAVVEKKIVKKGNEYIIFEISHLK